MCTGMSNGLKEVNDLRKSVVMDWKLEKFDFYVATLFSTDSLHDMHYCFFGKEKTNDCHEHGVGFAVKNSLASKF